MWFLIIAHIGKGQQVSFEISFVLHVICHRFNELYHKEVLKIEIKVLSYDQYSLTVIFRLYVVLLPIWLPSAVLWNLFKPAVNFSVLPIGMTSY